MQDCKTVMFIPKGPKFIAAFTYIDNKPVCLFKNKDKEFHYYVSFKEELCLGTNLYGTMINNYFICEKIQLFKNEKVNEYMQLPTLKIILDLIKDCDYLESISFKMPCMASSSFMLECSNLPYTVYGILYKTRMITIQSFIGGFQIKKRPELEDVYDLFALNQDKELIFYSTALVNDFKTSHYLKSLLYKKKANYQTIEFSDSEDEEYDRDVFVGCLFIPEFKKWKPYNFKNPDFIKTIQNLEKKNISI